MKDVKRVAVVGALVLVVMAVTGCSTQYSMKHDWDRINYESMTKQPAKS